MIEILLKATRVMLKAINIAFGFTVLLCSCSTKQYHYKYSLVSSSLDSPKISTNLNCFLGSEARVFSVTIGGKVKHMNNWESICNSQLQERLSISISDSHLLSRRDLKGMLFFDGGELLLTGVGGTVNVFGQCVPVDGGPDDIGCVNYETKENVEFSSLGQSFYVKIPSKDSKDLRFIFQLEKEERVHY